MARAKILSHRLQGVLDAGSQAVILGVLGRGLGHMRAGIALGLAYGGVVNYIKMTRNKEIGEISTITNPGISRENLEERLNEWYEPGLTFGRQRQIETEEKPVWLGKIKGEWLGEGLSNIFQANKPGEIARIN